MRILAYFLGCILQSSALDLHGQSAQSAGIGPRAEARWCHRPTHSVNVTVATARATGRGHTHWQPEAPVSQLAPRPCGEVQCGAPAPGDPPASGNTTAPPAFRPGLRAPQASLGAALAA